MALTARLLSDLSCAIGHASAVQEVRWMQESLAGHGVTDLGDRLASMVSRRVKGEPLQYVIGDVPFGPLTIQMRPPVLIPRPETEDWAIRLSELITPSPEKPISLLDLCTGTGCIPLLLCHVWSPGSVRATGVDILPSALKLARDNAVLNGVAVSEVGPLSQAFDSWKQNTFATYQADILSKDFARLSALEPPYDVITSNPPYIPRKDYDALDPSVKDWEDSRALLGDPDPLAPEAVSEGHRGLSFYHTIANLIGKARFLKRDGLVVLEVGEGQAADVARILEQKAQMRRIEIWKDPWDKERVLSFECAHSVQFCPLCTKYSRCISCKIHSQNILAHYRRRSPHLCSLSDLVSITFPSSLVLPSDFSSLPSPACAFSRTVFSRSCGSPVGQSNFFPRYSATHVRLRSTGTSTSGPIVAASA